MNTTFTFENPKCTYCHKYFHHFENAIDHGHGFFVETADGRKYFQKFSSAEMSFTMMSTETGDIGQLDDHAMEKLYQLIDEWKTVRIMWDEQIEEFVWHRDRCTIEPDPLYGIRIKLLTPSKFVSKVPSNSINHILLEILSAKEVHENHVE